MAKRTRPTHHSPTLWQFIKTLLKFTLYLMTGLAILRLFTEGAAAQVQNSTNNSSETFSVINNPYSNPVFSPGKVPSPNSAEDCDLIWERTLYGNDGTVEKQPLCVRQMTEPDLSNLDKAVEDGVNALIDGNHDLFKQIMEAWPVEYRKEYHDRVINAAKQNGVQIESEMPELPKNFQPKDKFEASVLGPHRQDILTEDQDEKIDPEEHQDDIELTGMRQIM